MEEGSDVQLDDVDVNEDIADDGKLKELNSKPKPDEVVDMKVSDSDENDKANLDGFNSSELKSKDTGKVVTEGKLGANEFDNATCKGKVKVGNEDRESGVKTESIKKTDIRDAKPFIYSQEGLLRLIRLDLGIIDGKEHIENSRTVEARIDNNIKSEELFDPPSKKLYRNITPDYVKVKHVDAVKVLASHKDEVEYNEAWTILMIQDHTKLMRIFKRKMKEMGIGSIGSEDRNTTVKKDDEDTKYGQEEERKKVMGMSDIHLVSVHVY
jgi:hypothetical protein